MGGMTMTQMWDELRKQGVSEQTLQVVTHINGYNPKTMHDILYVHTGYRAFHQLED